MAALPRESKALEYKREVAKTFLKTVSAFANYQTGSIVFGIADDLSIVGLEDPIAACLQIENMVNDSIEPTPTYYLEPDEKQAIVTLTVEEGPNKPYTYKSKAYKRNDSSTVEVNRFEFGRLIMEGENRTFDALVSRQQDLRFARLEAALRDRKGIEDLNRDVLRTLQLYSDDGGFTNAAAILADENDYKGIDIVRFGRSENELMDRETFEGVSALTQLDGALAMFEKYYRSEVVHGIDRETVDLVPMEAMRETLLNAIVHREWDMPANISVSMFADRIEVTSPGPLPSGLSEEEYANSRISIARNPILANVFFALRYIERFGTGISRIRESYARHPQKPAFRAQGNSVTVVLPVLSEVSLSFDEQLLLDSLSGGKVLSRQELQTLTGFEKDKAIRLLNSLLGKGMVEKRGEGRSVRYRRAR